MMLKGIDISHFQAEPNWEVLNDNVQVIYHKATEGVGYTDPKMVARVKAAKSHKLHVGIYHFARFTSVADAKNEAAYFIKVIKDNGLDALIDMPYVLDIETDDAKLDGYTMTQACIAFLEAVKAAFHKEVAVYTYDAFIGANLGKELGAYRLWLADYGDHVLTPNSVWNKIVALQYSDKGQVKGLNGGVDMDWFDSSMVIQPPAPKPAAPKVTKITHKVVAGDTVSELAAHYETTVDAIEKLNGINPKTDLIKIGQVLKIN